MPNKNNDKHKLAPIKKEEYVRPKTRFADGNSKNTSKLENIPSDVIIDIYYGIGGRIVDEGLGAFARKIEKKTGPKQYYVKFATVGSNVGRMLNPWGLYYTPGDEVRYEKQHGRQKYEFQRVNEEVFNTYIKFLTTRSERYILQAEREIGNG